MHTFEFKAMTRTGQPITGTIEAQDSTDASVKLSRRSLHGCRVELCDRSVDADGPAEVWHINLDGEVGACAGEPTADFIKELYSENADVRDLLLASPPRVVPPRLIGRHLAGGRRFGIGFIVFWLLAWTVAASSMIHDIPVLWTILMFGPIMVSVPLGLSMYYLHIRSKRRQELATGITSAAVVDHVMEGGVSGGGSGIPIWIVFLHYVCGGQTYGTSLEIHEVDLELVESFLNNRTQTIVFVDPLDPTRLIIGDPRYGRMNW